MTMGWAGFLNLSMAVGAEMTKEEAVKVAEVLESIDGGCYICAENAAVDMECKFPEHPWLELVRAINDREDLPDGYSKKGDRT